MLTCGNIVDEEHGVAAEESVFGKTIEKESDLVEMAPLSAIYAVLPVISCD